jgi:hypothetical protein
MLDPEVARRDTGHDLLGFYRTGFIDESIDCPMFLREFGFRPAGVPLCDDMGTEISKN